MAFNIAEARKDLQSFDLKKLFIEKMGWDIAKQIHEVQVNGEYFHLTMVAQKRGLAIFVCSPRTDGTIPDSALRYKIETQVRKLAHEHLIIFTNKDKTVQKWQWVRREQGKPIARREYDKPEVILHHLQDAVFDLEEEEDLTIIEVGQKIKKAFDVEKVTKKFYDRFKEEHADFLKFIKGIPDKEMQRWYVSVTLNRLMFIYFIQKKQFLDKDPDYLRHHLEQSKRQGKDLFYSDFLCPLFFEGFAKKNHSAEIKKLLGNIPYLNGGIFEQHQIEELYGKKIEIPDKAFEQLFDFFDDYRWHLDERPLKEGNEINPDVLGYIFEKYINQKQMGAYYTKEDITQYISQNTIIPHLFDAAQKECPSPLAPLPKGEGNERSAWRLLQADPDRYIYAAVRKGVDKALPTEIAIGESDPKRREGWNKPASEEFALPTEIWREVVARRRRYQEVKEKLTKGEVTSINDLITLNLDIRQFAQDVIEDSDADLLAAFWKALTQIKILDPTVGSGAFLFAALNVLEPLYEACLERMSALVDELDRSGEKHSPKKYEPFRKALEQVRQRPDEDYFIFKSIIINNLYGVDIMEEAVEICKLRLFLKLASQVEPDASKENLGIEPLPDIDFNIRAGNTLVGFATREDVKRSVQFGTVGGVQSEKLFAMPEEDAQLKRIEEKAEDVDRLYKLFRQQQTEYGGEVRPEDKRDLQKRLGELEKELNVLLAKQYGISLTPSPSPSGRGKSEGQGEGAYKKWLESHTPFHWFVEFFGIMNEGGFDVIIGNPPYVEYSKISKEYTLLPEFEPYSTNLYSACAYRALQIKGKLGRTSFIVPVSLPSTDRMKPLRNVLYEGHLVHHVSFSTRPSKLFDGAEQRLTIYIQSPSRESKLYSDGYIKWYKEERQNLFSLVQFHESKPLAARNNIWLKVRGMLGHSVVQKLLTYKPLSHAGYLGKSDLLYYKNTGIRYFNTVTLRAPKCWINGKPTSSSRETTLDVEDKFQHAVHCLLLSTSYFLYWETTSNCRDLNPSDIAFAPTPDVFKSVEVFNKLSKDIEKDYVSKGKIIKMNNKLTGLVELESLTPANSKPIIDEIDRALARHYGLSDEELDFIINYDVKYRMGASAEGDGDE